MASPAGKPSSAVAPRKRAATVSKSTPASRSTAASKSTPASRSTAASKPAQASKPTRASGPAEPSTAEQAKLQTTTVKRNATVAGKARSKATRATVTEAKSGAKLVGVYAERAVLVPVGAALTARDRVVGLVSDVIDTYGTRENAEAQLKRFERRGITARDRLERQTRSARARAEKEVSRRKTTVGRGVSDLDRRRAEAASFVTDRVDDVSTQIQSAASMVQEKVKSIA